MPKKKQRIILEGFTVSVNKLVIEQVSEIDDDTALQNGVRTAISRIVAAPAQLLAHRADDADLFPQHRVVSDALPPGPSKKRRGRPRRQSGDGLEATSGSEVYESVSSRTNSNPSSARSLILGLHSGGFFSQDRSIGDIREELHTQGHTLTSNHLSAPLISLTQQKILARRKDAKGQWAYRAGNHGQRSSSDAH